VNIKNGTKYVHLEIKFVSLSKKKTGKINRKRGGGETDEIEDEVQT